MLTFALPIRISGLNKFPLASFCLIWQKFRKWKTKKFKFFASNQAKFKFKRQKCEENEGSGEGETQLKIDTAAGWRLLPVGGRCVINSNRQHIAAGRPSNFQAPKAQHTLDWQLEERGMGTFIVLVAVCTLPSALAQSLK